MKIKTDDLNDGKVAELLDQHYQEMLLHSPPESVHALDHNALYSQDLCFWSAWIEGELAGCGALKHIDDSYGEIKSMRTDQSFKRKGVAAALLQVIIDEARNRGYQRLNLETGSMQVFIPARKLYEKYGFDYCPPFADYKEDPNSVCMVKYL